MPCTDREECSIVKSTKTEQSHNHDRHSHENEHCTPFCICSCCGISTVIQVIPNFVFTPHQFSEITTKEVSHYKFVYTQNYYAPIWQPPKIV